MTDHWCRTASLCCCCAELLQTEEPGLSQLQELGEEEPLVLYANDGPANSQRWSDQRHLSRSRPEQALGHA